MIHSLGEEVLSMVPRILTHLKAADTLRKDVGEMETSFVDDDDWRPQRDAAIARFDKSINL